MTIVLSEQSLSVKINAKSTRKDKFLTWWLLIESSYLKLVSRVSLLQLKTTDCSILPHLVVVLIFAEIVAWKHAGRQYFLTVKLI